MTDWILSETELHRLTGTRRRKARLRFFSAHNIPATVNAKGEIIVLRSAVEATMGGLPEEQRSGNGANWDALRKINARINAKAKTN